MVVVAGSAATELTSFRQLSWIARVLHLVIVLAGLLRV
jgi:hypothetical protein